MVKTDNAVFLTGCQIERTTGLRGACVQEVIATTGFIGYRRIRIDIRKRRAGWIEEKLSRIIALKMKIIGASYIRNEIAEHRAGIVLIRITWKGGTTIKGRDRHPYARVSS